ncbi:MAG: phenylalanine--tRNA ligase subunit alpha [Candidatus Woesearchaeota archaeon]|jgi:phenylalanyl-tRNA synthetase alpha chain|nr:phenylalanine--tRNA ligase subunit alpha [Candidatus Woesearchaeota archaeon]
MDIKKLADTLHPLERKVLPLLEKHIQFKDITDKSGLQEVEVMRALQWLQNKEVIKIKEEVKEVIELGGNGRSYIKKGLPEKRFLAAIKEKGSLIQDITKDSGISKEEVNICLGILRKKAAINIKKEKGLTISLTEQGKSLLKKELLEEELLKKQFPMDIASLKDEEKFALENLKSRKDVVKIVLQKLKSVELTELGKKVAKSKTLLRELTERLTPLMIKNQSWKNKEFRRYDIKINVPSIHGGRKQHYRRFLDEVRQKFLSLGFTEMFGKIIETEFWNMDALFMPQDHSARDIHSAYYTKDPKQGSVDQKLMDKVRASHENGTGTISTGWQYKFDIEKTKQLLLRTQGTACSARMLASKELKIPGKYFSIARCFRPDVIDATHNVDFFQTEGIIIEENLDFRHLKGLLKMFAEEFAKTDQVKITPAYFPFTEPSAELHAKHPELGWIELAGSGIFRPELVKPILGREIPVLAWGIGIDRIAMFNLGIKDIRQLFTHDLNILRTSKVI